MRKSDPSEKSIRVLFLCTGNSCRSQMAEGWVKKLKKDRVEAWSAGIAPKGVDPRAVKVMSEAGVDISSQSSRDVSELMHIDFDCVITLCDNAHESCPLFPGDTEVIHIGFDDPPRLAQNAQTEDEALDCYRGVRDEIRAFVEKLPECLRTS